MNKEIAILRETVIKLAQLLSDKGIRVTQMGMKAYVESDEKGRPVRVNLPMIPDNASEALIIAIQGFLDHEVAHLLFTDFNIVTEAHKLDPIIANLFNIVEDTYIERAMHKKFPGSGYNLENLHNFFIKNITEPMLAKCVKKNDFISVLVVPACRAWSGQVVFQRFMDEDDKWDFLKSWSAKIGDLYKEIPKIESSKEAFDLAIEIYNALMIEGDPDEEEKKATGGAGSSGGKPGAGSGGASGGKAPIPKGRTEVGAGGGSTADGTSLNEADRSKVKNDELPEDDELYGKPKEKSEEESEEKEEEEKSSKGSSSEEESEEDGSTASEEESEEEEEVAGGSEEEEKSSATEKLTPDDMKEILGSTVGFDDAISGAISKEAQESLSAADYTVFTRDFDKIEALEVKEKDCDSRWVQTLENTMQAMVGVMQKELERLMAAKSRVTWHGGHRSGRLHGASLARLATNDDRIFRRKEDNRSKDVAVSLVVDCSGSMGGGGKITVACAAAYGLSMVLERIGIKHEVIGFTTGNHIGRYGWRGSVTKDPKILKEEEEMRAAMAKKGKEVSRVEALYMPIFKGYDERITPAIKRRFAAVPHMGFLANNIDGESVEIAAQRLMARTASRKILMVLSDGYPAGAGDSQAQNRKLATVVRDVEKAGIETIGIGILSDAVKRFYPKFVVLNNIHELPTTVMGYLKKVLL